MPFRLLSVTREEEFPKVRARDVHLNYEYALALSYNAFERHPL